MRGVLEKREGVIDGVEERRRGYHLSGDVAAGDEIATEELSVDLAEMFGGFAGVN